MSPFAKQIFARLLAADTTFRSERQLDLLVEYAISAQKACVRYALKANKHLPLKEN